MKTVSTLVLAFALLAVALPAFPAGFAPIADAAIVTPSFTTHVAPSTLLYATAAAEPSLGVNWKTGAVMYQAGPGTFRVTFNDAASPPTATWALVRPPNSVFNVDPILFTDHVNGRTFAGGLDGPCSVMSYTDNDGASWTPMGNVCAGAAVDHPTIGSGAWSAAGVQPPRVYNRSVYYCAQSGAVQCAVSQDGGVTFGPGVAVQCGYVDPGLHGSIHVGPDGTAYLPFKGCGSFNGVAVSPNNGVSWSQRPIPEAYSAGSGFDPDVATTKSGWAYVGYPTSQWGVGVALTKDRGATWTNFGDVAAAAGVKSATFHEMLAGDDGRAAVVYLGSTTDGNPHASSFPGLWYVYVTYTLDAGATWTTVKASTNLIQRGWICAAGINCNAGRNLLDFIDAQVDAKGRVVVAVADGCTGTCETGSGPSNSGFATIVRQSGGSPLFAAHDPATFPDAPVLAATPGPGSASLAWTTPRDNDAPITSYRVYRDGARVATVGAVNAYVDGGLTNGGSYAYQVSAVNSVGEGPRSNLVSVTPRDVPAAPLLEGSADRGVATLSWSAPADNGAALTGYRVYRDGAPVAELGLQNAFTDEGLTNGATYAYAVSAVNAVGEGPASAALALTPRDVPSAPVLSGAAGPGRASLAWSAPADNGAAVTGYHVYRDGVLLAAVGPEGAYEDATVVNGATYGYAVSALNVMGEGPLSGVVSLTPLAPPSAPRDVQARHVEEPTSGNVLVTWSAPATDGGRPVVGYKVYRGTVPGSETLVATLGDVLSFKDKGLQRGVVYHYKVTAVNAVGESPLSNGASAIG